MPVELRLLGGVTVLHGGAATRVALERPVSLLVRLAVAGEWVERAELARLYRPDTPEAEALTYVRKLVFRARRYAWASTLEVTADALRWQVSTDVARFAAAAASRDWAGAVTEYGGRFLGGASLGGAPGFEAWREAEDRALEAALLEARTGLAQLHEEAGRYEEAAQLHQAVVSDDPFAETSVQALMRLLSQTGRRQAALAEYERFRQALEQELGATPLEATEALADELLRPAAGAGAGQSAPAGASTELGGQAPGAALPIPGTPFVGRSQELRALRSLLHEEQARLVTIVGLGGSGKTRLALEAANRERLAGREVAFVSLAATSSAAAAASAVVEALGTPWHNDSAEDSLVKWLRHRELLLVLDNFESALDAAPLVAKLLATAPGLTVIATSREPLKLQPERLLDIGGLEAPPLTPGGTLPHGRGPRGYDAVRLYVQQAARVTPGLKVRPEHMETIGQICNLLEGLPLAIELAASWSPLLSTEEILAEVDRDPGALVSHHRDVPERHRSLWRVFDHTWERLTAEERSALVSLSVFPAGFGLAAARSVTGAELGTLLRLMDLKLLRRTGEGRFELHQLVKQYAAQPSLAGAAVERARSAHSHYYCQLLLSVSGDLEGNDVHAGLGAVRAELPNVMSAWRHAATRADHQALDAARNALNHFFYYRGDFARACQLFGDAAAALDTATDASLNTANVAAGSANEAGSDLAAARVAARLLVHHSEHERHRGRPARSLELATQALERLQDAGDDADVAYARLSLGTSLLRVSAYAESKATMSQVLAYARRAGDLYLQGAAHNVLALLVTATEGNVAEAESHYRASLEVNRTVGNLEGVNGALINLGACRFDLNDMAGAIQLWQEAAAIAVKIGHKQREAVLHNNIGSLYEAQGRPEEAEARYRQSLDLRRQIDDRSGQANALHNLGRLAANNDDPWTARQHLEEALRLFVQTEEPASEAHVRSSLARLLANMGEADHARSEAQASLALALKLDSRAEILMSLLTVALLHEHAGELPRAAELAAEVASAAAGTSEPLKAAAEKLRARTAAAGAPTGGARHQEPDRQADGPHQVHSGSSDEALRHVAKRELSQLRV